MCPARALSRAQRAATPGTMCAMSEPLHLVDTTMFWSPTGGGVRRYLQTKHAVARRPAALAPHDRRAAGRRRRRRRSGAAIDRRCPAAAATACRCAAPRIARVLTALAPDVIEAGDPYRVAWAARDAAQALGIPAVAYCHSNLVALARLAAGRRFGNAAARAAERYARHVYAGFDLVLAPSRSMAAHLADWGVARVACQPLGVDTAALSSVARAIRPGASATAIRPATRLLVYAGRFAPEKHLDVLADAVRRLGAPYALLAIGAGPTPPPPASASRVAAFRRLDARAGDGAGERRCLRPRRRPGDLRPVGARGDGLRHAGGRPRRRRAGRAGRRRRPAAPSPAAAARPSPRRSPRCSSGDRDAVAARAAARRRAEAARLAARPARLRRPLPCACSASRAVRRTARDATSRSGPIRDERRRPSPRPLTAPTLCIVLHDAAPSTRSACVRTLAAVRRGRRRRAGDAPRRAALSRRSAERRVRGLARRAHAPRRRARPARLHPSRRRRAAGPARPPAPLALHPRRRRVLGALARARRWRGIDVGIEWFAKNGWPLSGFVAPAWLLGPGAREALVERPFDYTATLRQLIHLPAQLADDQPERRLQHLERVAAQQLARLERARRPRPSASNPRAAHRAASARRRLRRGAPLLAAHPRARAASGGDRPPWPSSCAAPVRPTPAPSG